MKIATTTATTTYILPVLLKKSVDSDWADTIDDVDKIAKNRSNFFFVISVG